MPSAFDLRFSGNWTFGRVLSEFSYIGGGVGIWSPVGDQKSFWNRDDVYLWEFNPERDSRLSVLDQFEGISSI